MKTGPRPKPTLLRVLEGNRGHRPMNEREPKPAADMPAPPSFLDAYALEEWNRVAPELYAIGVLTAIDGATLGAYCDSYSTWRRATEALASIAKTNDRAAHGGMILKTQSGNEIQHPLVGIANKAKQDMVRVAAEFGITPSSRTTIETSKRGEANKTARKFGLE